MTNESGNQGSSQGPVPPIVPTARPGPKGGKRDRNRRLRTQAILDAALGQFLEEGVEGVTIDAIAKAAGVAKGSFYRYFKDKTQLVEALIEPMVSAVLEAFAGCQVALDQADDAMSLTLAYMQLGAALEVSIREHSDLARLYLLESRGHPRGAREPLVRFAEHVALGAVELTHQAQAHGLLRKIDPRVSALAVVGAAERLLAEFLSGNLDDLEQGAVQTDLIALVLQGVGPQDA